MSSPCLSAGGRAYGFDLDLLLKSPSPSPSPSTSSPSSTLSESSNSHIAISTKKARTPRKRPNQTYHEAAALLSTVYPNVFSSSTTTAAAKSLRHLRKHLTLHFDAFSEPSDLLPPFSGLTGAAFLLSDPPSQEKPTFTPKPSNSIPKACESPPSIEFQQPIDDDDDFDAQSMLDEEVGEGIDSILGNLSMSTNSDNAENESFLHNACFGPYLGSLVGFRFGSAYGFGFDANVRRALRRGDDDGDWWRSPRVAVRDIVPKFKSLSASLPPPLAKKSKKKKKKVEEESETRELQQKTITCTASIAATNADAIDKNLVETSSTRENLKASLNLKLNFEEVLKEWSDRGSPFGDSGSPESSADVHARLAQMDLFPETGNGREASVQRYKEKRRNRLFSKKIRYQVRKVNADRRPRMKARGRFVKRPALLHQAIEEESP